MTADEAAKAEAESIATRWVPAHMTARQGLVDDIAKAIVTERRLAKEARDEALREAADLVHLAAVGADTASGGATGHPRAEEAVRLELVEFNSDSITFGKKPKWSQFWLPQQQTGRMRIFFLKDSDVHCLESVGYREPFPPRHEVVAYFTSKYGCDIRLRLGEP